MSTNITTSNRSNYDLGQVNDRQNDHKNIRGASNINKDAPVLNLQDHALVMEVEKKLAEHKWDRDTRQLVLDIVREESGQPDAESYNALLNTRSSKNDFVRLIIANKNGMKITHDNSHLLSQIEKKEVSAFKKRIAGLLQVSPEKNELLLKNGSYGLAQQIKSDRWDAHCCDKVMKLVDAMWEGCLTQTVPENEQQPHTVNNANLQSHINNHLSKRKDKHSPRTIDRFQFLQLLLAAKKQQGASSPSRKEVQELQTAIENALAEHPSASQQALIPQHNPFANTETLTFGQPNNGKDIRDMTGLERATFLLNLSSAVRDIAPKRLDTPDKRFTDPLAGKTGLVPSANKAKNPFTPMPETCKDSNTANIRETDNTIKVDNTANTENFASRVVKATVAGAIGALAGGPKTALAAGVASIINPADGMAVNLRKEERIDLIKKKDMLKSIEENVNVDITDPPGEMMGKALKQAYRWAPFAHADERLDNDRIKVTLHKSEFPVKWLYQVITGSETSKYFTPYEIASGEVRKYVEGNNSPYRNVINGGCDYTWPDDYPTFLRDTLKDGDILSIVEDKLDAALKLPENIQKIKGSMRDTAIIMAEIYNITHPNSTAVELTEKDLNNVQQLVFQGTTLSNLFLHKGYIFSLSPGFEPVNYNKLMSSLNTPMPKALREEIDRGLSYKNRIEHAGKDKALANNDDKIDPRKQNGLIPGKKSGTVEDILSEPAIENVTSDFDFSTWTRAESNIFRAAETLKFVLALFPIWGPAMKIRPLYNMGISLLGCTPSVMKAVIEDNPEKQKKHITEALINLATNAVAGASANVNAPAIRSLSSRSAQLIINNPQNKLDLLAKFIKSVAKLTGDTAKGGYKNVADFWNSLNQGQKMLLARILGNSGKLFYSKLAKLFADENKGTTGPTAGAADGSTSNVYMSKKGESLWKISNSYEKLYNNHALQAFWAANQNSIPDGMYLDEELPEGTPIIIPDPAPYKN
ncbi:LysM peptidoglycan-binding domain-containing protein [Erwiniaceae bacterium L1_54_6]|nr:LysM peptidoglycan-binding domain-containing protein [Erwiniaceae bacterium L1_54_6]